VRPKHEALFCRPGKWPQLPRSKHSGVDLPGFPPNHASKIDGTTLGFRPRGENEGIGTMLPSPKQARMPAASVVIMTLTPWGGPPSSTDLTGPEAKCPWKRCNVAAPNVDGPLALS